MSKVRTKIKRKLRNRKKLKSLNNKKLRISIYKTLKNISAQIIDDNNMKTLVSASSTEKTFKGKKTKKGEISALIGEVLAKRAVEKKIENVYFDRGSYKYHGRVKNLAESLRKKEEIIIRLDSTLMLPKKQIIQKFIKIDPNKIISNNLKLSNLFLIQLDCGPRDIRNKNNIRIGIITVL